MTTVPDNIIAALVLAKKAAKRFHAADKGAGPYNDEERALVLATCDEYVRLESRANMAVHAWLASK